MAVISYTPLKTRSHFLSPPSTGSGRSLDRQLQNVIPECPCRESRTLRTIDFRLIHAGMAGIGNFDNVLEQPNERGLWLPRRTS